MYKPLFRVFINALLVFAGYNIYKKVSSSLDQWEREPELNLGRKQSANEEMIYDINRVIEINEGLMKKFDELRKTLYFKIFKLNLEPECTVFKQDLICKSSSCAVCECSDNEIPAIWKQKTHQGEKVNVQIKDPFLKWEEKYSFSTQQWLVQEEVDSTSGTFINLLNNPEGYTGYRGQHIWDAIFRENCFSDKISQLCKEDKVFYRIFSGWLSNTNMQIGMNYHNRETNLTYMNVSMITSRLLNSKERVDYLFFLYSLMIKSMTKAETLLKNFEYNSGNTTEDTITMRTIDDIFKGKKLRDLEDSFNETTLDFENFMHSKKIGNLIARFRNISSIVDCVSCGKCRMQAKLDIFGISTMFKIMFSHDNELKERTSRNELVAFINLFFKLSKTISQIKLIDENIKKGRLRLRMKYFGLACVLLVLCYVINRYSFEDKTGQGSTVKVNAKKHS